MPNAFDENNPPFDRLTPQEVEALRRALDIAYFRPAEIIIAQGAPADALYVVIKGVVEECAGDEIVALLGQTIHLTAAPRSRPERACLPGEGRDAVLSAAQKGGARSHSEQPAFRCLLLPRNLPQTGCDRA